MRGLALTTAQYSLMKVEDKDPHPKNWRYFVIFKNDFSINYYSKVGYDTVYNL